MKRNYSIFKSFIFLLSVAVLSSCASRKDVVYFQNANDFETVVNTDTFNPKFKIDDILDIHISTYDMEATKPFNLVRASSEGSGQVQTVDYLIDKDGYIDYPVLGKIKLLGLSTEQAKELFRQKLEDGGYLNDPIINIRIKNFTVTILGEVNRPGTYTVDGERITILEAMGLAGDLRIKGKRDNVMVIRDFNGTKVYTRINLTSKEALDSPVYYLTQNDVVYVEPNQSAVASSSLDNRANLVLSVVSTLITLASVIVVINQ